MREKLIDLLGKTPGIAWSHSAKQTVADHLIANGVILDNQVSSSKWIHVLEKLPENEQWVLCIMKDGRFRVFQWSYIDWQWNDELEWYDEYDVTCWMPLPEPPKGE